MKYPKVGPLCLNFRLITVKFCGVRKFTNFTVVSAALSRSGCFFTWSESLNVSTFGIGRISTYCQNIYELDCEKTCFSHMRNEDADQPRYYTG